MPLTTVPAFRIKHLLIVAGAFLLSLSSPAQCAPDSIGNTKFTISKGYDYFHQYDCGDTALYAFSPAALFDSLGVIPLYEAQRIACAQYGLQAVEVRLHVHDDPAKNTWEVRGNFSSRPGGRGHGNTTVKYTAIFIDVKGQAKAVKGKYRSLQEF